MKIVLALILIVMITFIFCSIRLAKEADDRNMN